MNYNKGCYRQPSADNRRMIHSHADQCRIMSSNIRPQNDICDTKDMNYTLAMVYSPYQEWQNIYNGEKGLECGTIFAELDKPFLGYKNGRGPCCL